MQSTAAGDLNAPLFTFRAHCFQIDSKTKRSWLPLSDQAMQISVMFEAARQAFRFVSLEHPLPVNGSSAGANPNPGTQLSLDAYLLSSCVLPSTTFTRTSAKFLQWFDVRAQTVFGLGFSSEADLNRFVERFKSVREAFQISTASAAAVQNQPLPQSVSANSKSTPNLTKQLQSLDRKTPDGASIIMRNSASQATALNLYSHQTAVDSIGGSLSDNAYANGNGNSNSNGNGNSNSNGYGNADVSSNGVGVLSEDLPSTIEVGEYVELLRSENEKLRSALQTNSGNYRKWQDELTNGRVANEKLQAELNEARSNNTQLTEQLAETRTELSRLRSLAVTMDQHDRDRDRDALRSSASVDRLVEQVAKLKLDVETKQNEVDYLKQRITELLALETRFETLSREVEQLEADRDSARRELAEERVRGDDRRRETNTRLQEALLVHTDAGRTLTALTQLYNQLTTRLKDAQLAQPQPQSQRLTPSPSRIEVSSAICVPLPLTSDDNAS